MKRPASVPAFYRGKLLVIRRSRENLLAFTLKLVSHDMANLLPPLVLPMPNEYWVTFWIICGLDPATVVNLMDIFFGMLKCCRKVSCALASWCFIWARSCFRFHLVMDPRCGILSVVRGLPPRDSAVLVRS